MVFRQFILLHLMGEAARDKGFGMKFLPYIILILSLLRICSTKEVPEGLEGGINDVQIHRLHVNAVITSRFSRTIITSQASNHANVSKEISFDVELPKEAFISNFSMTIDGKTYAGVVKEKEIAHKVYTDAISRGQSAGIVKASGRLLERFKVEVSLSPRSEIIFQLTYEELLRRKLGQYQILLKVQPKQLVEDFQIEVLINETRAISFLDAEGTFLTNDLKLMVEKSYSGNKGHVLFKPPLDTQRSCPVCTSTVLDGEFTVKYDVDRSHSGDIQVVNGYFVHFFAPVNLPQIPKRVVFVIDVSGSMSGRKIQQTREALLRILDDLHPDDYFNLIIFSSIAAPWKKSLVRAGKVNVENAKKHVRTLQANGGTNLNEAVLSAVSLLLQNKPTGKSESTKAPMIILLTDGDPTVGEVKTAQIKANVKQAINGQLSLYCLGFGRDLDYSFLQTLALENGGVARRIYEDSDADLQLQGFYKEVAQPLLTNVQVVYPEHAVSHLTKSTFQRYYGGSEIIIAGIITDNELTELPSEITAQGARDRLSFNASSLVGLQQDYIFGEYTERLWAYLTILQLLEEQIVAEGEHKEHLKAQALSLSLKYNFVTPLSSMVVTKPERKGNQSVVAEKMNEGALEDEPALQAAPLRLMQEVTAVEVNPCDPGKLKERGAVSPQSFVDGDPHFIVRPSGGNQMFCFNIQQRPGVFLSLVDDPVTGITVNGELVGKNKDGSIDASGNTYIGKLGLQSLRTGIKMEVTTESITINSSTQNSVLTWNNTGTASLNGLALSILDGKRVNVTIEEMVTFIIVLHRPLKKTSKHRNYLGLYTEDSHRLSKKTSGILGQFYHYPLLEIMNVSTCSSCQDAEAILSIRGKKIKVSRQWRKDFQWDTQHGEEVFCWFVPGGGAQLMDRQEDYFLVPGLYGSLSDPRVWK